MMSVEQIKNVADQLRAASRMHLRAGNEVPPTIFVVARENPITGAPVDEANPIIPLVQPPTMSKERFAQAARGVAVASKARAAIICLDAWHVRIAKTDAMQGMSPDDALRHLEETQPRARDHEDRQEAVILLLEFDDGPVFHTSQVYRRDEGRLLFEDVVSHEMKLDDRRGVFTIIPPASMGEPPAEAMASARNISTYILQGVDWIPAAFEVVKPGDEEAQAANG